jgi:hypothetical protein
MKSFANRPNVRYAIIRASSTHDSPELLVLAYADETSLRSLIAETSIIAIGFPSRSAADAAGSLHQTLASHNMHAIPAIRSVVNQRFSLAFRFGRSRLMDALTCWKGFDDLYTQPRFSLFIRGTLCLQRSGRHLGFSSQVDASLRDCPLSIREIVRFLGAGYVPFHSGELTLQRRWPVGIYRPTKNQSES